MTGSNVSSFASDADDRLSDLKWQQSLIAASHINTEQFTSQRLLELLRIQMNSTGTLF